MIVVKKNFRQGDVVVKLSLQDDFWYLSHIISPGDIVKGKTERKIKIGDGSDSRSSVVRKIMHLSLTVEDVSFSSDELRVKGTVAKEHDDVPIGSFHSISFKLHDTLALTKPSWPSYVQKKFEEAAANTAQHILVVLFDREEALYSLVSQQGIRHLGSSKAEVQNKQYATSASDSIVDELIASVQNLLQTNDISSLVFASPAFWHSSLQKKLPADLKKKSVMVTTHAVHKGAVVKLLARQELKSLLKDQRLSHEQEQVDAAIHALAKEQLAYGLADVSKAAEIGAVASILVSDSFMQKQKEEGLFATLDELLQSVDAAKGDVHIIFSPDLVQTIDGLGGVVGILRWKI